MRALMALTIGMGVLIVAGTATIAVTIFRRMGAGAAPVADAMLAEPAGTRIAGIAGSGERVALWLQGGGPDRVVVWDAAHGRIAGRLSLKP